MRQSRDVDTPRLGFYQAASHRAGDEHLHVAKPNHEETHRRD